ncbi:MliC family protein [Marivibrio halodurans]|uniref:MliC family protein n=1 Tax=Marivibrio halodurans TaxID=2039722 RepID=A0A8J7S3H9_9PROT|nr:MliC family protein [Marivibrio halodurans]MBP5856014.1 MliC family protein [Marivibrio halodurans]
MRRGWSVLLGLMVTGISCTACARDDAVRALYRCEGLDEPLTAVFRPGEVAHVRLDAPGLARMTLPQGRSASGARYIGTDAMGRSVLFWIKGRDAMLEIDGRDKGPCRTDMQD